MVNLDTINRKDVPNKSEIFSSVKVIVLENKKDALLGIIEKIYPYQNKLFILDSQFVEGVLEFDKNGRFIRKIGNKGNAPGEYSSCGDFAINEQLEEIYLFDYRHNRINKYDIKTGKYKESLDIEKQNRVDRIWVNSGRLYGVNRGFYPSDSKPYYALKEIDLTNGKKIGEWMRTDEYNQGWIDSSRSIQFFYPIDKDTDLFTYGVGDSIMYIHDGELCSHIALTGKRILKKEDIPTEALTPPNDAFLRTKESSKLFNKLSREDKIITICDIFQHNKKLYFSCHGKIIYSAQYDISKNKVSAFPFIEDDILFSKSPDHHMLPRFLTSDKSGVYYVVGTDFLPELKHFATEKGVMSDKVINKDKLEKLDEDSNPVILYYEFKK